VPLEQTNLYKFIKSRNKNDTRFYAKIILKYLITEKPGNVVRSRDLRENFVSSGKIPNPSTLYELLDNMERYELIERIEEQIKSKRKKSGGGKKAVYYRVNPNLTLKMLDMIDSFCLTKTSLDEISEQLNQIPIDATIDLSSESSVSGHMTTKRERECEQELKIAKEILKEYGLNPDEEIEKRIKSLVPS